MIAKTRSSKLAQLAVNQITRNLLVFVGRWKEQDPFACLKFGLFGLFFQPEQCFSLTTIQSEQCFSAKIQTSERGQ